MASSRVAVVGANRSCLVVPICCLWWFSVAFVPEQAEAAPPDLSPGPMQIPAVALRSWAEDEQAREESPDSDSGSLVLLSRTDVTVRKEGPVQVRRWTIHLLRTQDSVRESIRMESDWSPWHSERPTLAARIIQPDGGEIRMDDSKAIEQSVGGRSNDTIDDTKQLVVLLVGLRIGSIVETVETVEYRPSLPNSFVDSYVLAGFTRIAVSQLVVQAELGAGFQWEVPGGGFTPQIQRQAGSVSGYKELVFELQPAKPIYHYWQPSSGPDHAAIPLVRVGVPGRWDEVAKAYKKLVDPQVEQARPIAELMTAGIPSEASDQQKVDLCVERLRRAVVYTGVEFGINRIVPYAAEEILSRGFGDCKDQAMLLVAMLDCLKVDANMALLSAGSGLDVSASFPAISDFNHMIVRVDGPTPLWVDPTAVGLTSGLLPVDCSNRRCLIIDEDTTELALTPRLKPSDDVYLAETEFRVDSSGFGTMTEGMYYERLAATRMLAGASEDRSPESLKAYLGDLLEVSAEGMAASYDEQNGGTLRLNVEYDPQQIGQSDSTRTAYAFDLRPALHSVPSILLSPTAVAGLNGVALSAEAVQAEDEAAVRTSPVVIASAFRERRSVSLSYPSFLQASSLPESSLRQIGPVSIRFDAEKSPTLENGRLQVVLSCEVVVDPSAGDIQASELESIRAELEAYATEASPLVGTIVLSDTEAVEWFRRGGLEPVIGLAERCNAHPDDAYAVARLAEALAAVHLLDAARTKALAAVQIAPASPLSMQAAESVLVLGDRGTVAGDGFHIQALRKLARRFFELYPESVLNLDFARAFLLDEHGFREGDAAHHQQAIAMLRGTAEASEAPPNFRDHAASQLAMLFLMAGRDQESVQMLNRLSSSTAGSVDGLRVLAAVMRGEDLMPWVDHRRALPGNAAGGGSAVAQACSLATTSGRFDLFEKLVADLKREDRAAQLPDWHRFVRFDQEPAELDETDPISVARIGLARYLTGREEDLCYSADPPPVVVGEADSWSPGALEGLLQRLEITEQIDTLGGQQLTFAPVLGLSRAPTVQVVPVEEGKYRWFFVGDAAGLAQWTRHLADAPQQDHAREALDRLSSLAGPLPWFDQFTGSPAARAWVMLRNGGAEELKLAAALFTLELSSPAASTARAAEAAERAAERDEYAKVQIQIWRSLERHYGRSGRPDQRYETIKKLLARHPGSAGYLDGAANLAMDLDRIDDCRTFFAQIAADQTPVERQVSELLLLAQTGPFTEVLEGYDQLGEELETHKPFLANAVAWAALQRNAEVDLLGAFTTRLDAMIPVDRNPSAAHTLACLQAATGQSEAAYETLRDFGWLGGVRTPAQLYAFGALCQSVGLEDVARDYYQATVDEFAYSSSAALARLRLAGK